MAAEACRPASSWPSPRCSRPRFYYRPGSQRPTWTGLHRALAEIPHLDFHEILSLLSDHPVLLRLGLVVDLVVDLPDRT